MLKKLLKVLAVLLVAAMLLVLAVWLIPRPAGSWGQQEQSSGYTGAFAQNNALAELAYLDLAGYTCPEALLVHEGWLYVTVRDGVLLRMREDGSEMQKVLDTGGCLLGFAFDAAGDIIAADCDYNGTGALLKTTADGTGTCEVLVNKESGSELFYPNAVVAASDGMIYFTDSTSAFPPAKYDGSSSLAAANETFMHTCTGRVLAYDPETKSVRQLADGLAFANGIALSEDEASLFVCETYAYAVRRIDIKTGETAVLLDNLPGFPDNLTQGLDGRYWVGMNGERSASLDAISDKTLLRKVLWLYGKVSSAADEGSGGYCHVFAFTEDGTVTESLQSGSNDYYRSTGATETAERLYIQSINNSGKLAYIERAAGQQADKQN